MPLSKIPSAGFQDNVKFRNLIINGDFSQAQRGTSVSSHSSDSYTTLDRWKTRVGGQGVWTVSQSTDVPSGQGFANSLKWDCTTADASPAASDFLLLEQRLEGQNLQYLKKGTSSAESLTISFWVKSNKTGTYICELDDRDNTRAISKSYTINSASTWEKKTITFEGDTTGTLNNDNANSFSLGFWLGAGSNYTSGTLATSWETRTNANRAVGQVNLADSTSNEWYITGVQLESGTVASSFETLPTDINLMRCQRYYEAQDTYENTTSVGSANGNWWGKDMIYFNTTKRASPTITLSNTSIRRGDNYSVITPTLSTPSISEKSFGFQTSGSTANVDELFVSGDWEADAEL